MNFSNYAAALALFASAANVYATAPTELNAAELVKAREDCMERVNWMNSLTEDEQRGIFVHCMKNKNTAYDEKIIEE